MAALANNGAMYLKTDSTGRSKYGPLTLEELILDTAAITCVQRRRDNSARTHGLVKTQDLVEPIGTSRRTIIADSALAIQTPPQPMSANTSIRSSP